MPAVAFLPPPAHFSPAANAAPGRRTLCGCGQQRGWPAVGAAAPAPASASASYSASSSASAAAARSAPAMIQRPDEDGPPDMAAFFDRSRRAVGAQGPPIAVSTGRARLAAHAGDSAHAAADALARALEALPGGGEPQLCHCTFALDVDAPAVAERIRELIPDSSVPVIARSVNKKDWDGTIEVLLLHTDAPEGIAYAEAAIETPVASGPAGEPAGRSSQLEQLDAAAAAAAAKAAAADAIAAVGGPGACTFLVFAHTPSLRQDAEGGQIWTPDAAVRQGIEAACPGVIAYGGAAVGSVETGANWTLFSGSGKEDVSDAQRVCVAAVPGSINFLTSAVVKNWAQPSYTEPLSFMVPTYTGDASRDLLTAIRYDDWDRFVWCVEDQGVDVNICWPDKQNQSPLLAACARARTRMVDYLIKKGANVHHRNNGNFTAAMYTRKLTEYDRSVVLAQLKALQDGGLDTALTPEDEQAVRDSGDGRIFLDSVE